MSLDFFLQNRAHQISRLCTGDKPKVDLSIGVSRGKKKKELAEFGELVARICAAEQAGTSGLTEAEKKDLEQFERSVVSLRFSADEETKRPAVSLIKAIFADAEYFSGLKPLPQYTDVFAYELLFPSWLNLLTATMLPKAGSGKPRVEGKRQGVLFEFLGKARSTGAACESRLVGLLTFVARRFEAPLCEELLQRFVDLFSLDGCELVERIESIEATFRDARQFAQRLREYLTVRHSMNKWPATSKYPIAYHRPALRVLPESTSRLLAELDEAANNWDAFFSIAGPLRLLINSNQLLTAELTAELESHPEQNANLLSLIIQGDEADPKFMPTEGQSCLAMIIRCESLANNQLDNKRLAAFAGTMAPRLTGFSETSLGYFFRNYIQDDEHRRLLLEACGSETARDELAASILERAGHTEDDARCLDLLRCATVFTLTDESLAAKNALLAIDAVVQNRSIGNKEFGDLVGDLRANVSEALKHLSAPIMVAGHKSPRLAALYMTLSEVAETYAATGKAQNFSVVRAKYAAITNIE